MPFREAHGVVGGLVRDALDAGRALSELGAADLAAHSELLEASEVREVLDAARQLESKRSEGGTSSERVAEQLAGRAGRGRRAAPGMRAAEAPPAAEALEAAFFDRDVHLVARELIGCSLRFRGAGGVIVETESYERDDPACHAYVGLTDRTEVLFGPPGRVYVYLSYGIHHLLNFVAEPEGSAAAVLIRALEPVWGLDGMRARRGLADERALCSGPGKLTQALGIDLEMNRVQRARAAVRAAWARARVGGRRGRLRAPDRDQRRRRQALALLRRGQPVPLGARGLSAASGRGGRRRRRSGRP